MNKPRMDPPPQSLRSDGQRIHANKEIHHRDTESTEVKIRRLHRLRRFFLRLSYRPANERHGCSNCVSFDSSTRGGLKT
jgi:hypothetical protein